MSTGGIDARARSPSMVAFALSCFGLLLFLWLAFGGPMPLKPKGYRVKASVRRGDARSPRRPTCAISGVPVGKVKSIEPDTRHRAARRR